MSSININRFVTSDFMGKIAYSSYHEFKKAGFVHDQMDEDRDIFIIIDEKKFDHICNVLEEGEVERLAFSSLGTLKNGDQLQNEVRQWTNLFGFVGLAINKNDLDTDNRYEYFTWVVSKDAVEDKFNKLYDRLYVAGGSIVSVYKGKCEEEDYFGSKICDECGECKHGIFFHLSEDTICDDCYEEQEE